MSETSLSQLMAQILQKEYSCYEEMYFLSEKQLNLLISNSDDAIDEIADLMSRKKKIADSIPLLENQHVPIKKRWDNEYLSLSLEERDEIGKIRDSSLRLIERLRVLEDEIYQRISQKKDHFRHRLSTLHQGKAVQHAYFNTERLPPRFIDKKK